MARPTTSPTRKLTGEQQRVLQILCELPDDGDATLTLREIEARMGPMGRRSPAAEALDTIHEAKYAQTEGKGIRAGWRATDLGRKTEPRTRKWALDELLGRIQAAAQHALGEEVKRLQWLADAIEGKVKPTRLDMMPPPPTDEEIDQDIDDLAHRESMDDDDDQEAQPAAIEAPPRRAARRGQPIRPKGRKAYRKASVPGER